MELTDVPGCQVGEFSLAWPPIILLPISEECPSLRLLIVVIARQEIGYQKDCREPLQSRHNRDWHGRTPCRLREEPAAGGPFDLNDVYRHRFLLFRLRQTACRTPMHLASEAPTRSIQAPWWWINHATTPNDCSVLRANDICPLRVRGRIQPSHAEHQCTDEPKISVTASNAKPSPKSSPSPPTSSPNSPAKPSPPSPPPSARQGNTPQWCGRGSQPEVEKRFGTSRDRDEGIDLESAADPAGCGGGGGRRTGQRASGLAL